jgi:hypothetical protein
MHGCTLSVLVALLAGGGLAIMLAALYLLVDKR